MGAMLVRHELSSVASVRREITAELSGKGVRSESVDDVALVASELVGNAIRHASPIPENELDVAWTLNVDNVLISVADGSSAEPQLRVPGPDEPAGRGLTIIDKLSSTWGVEQLKIGKRVWAYVPISVGKAAHHA